MSFSKEELTLLKRGLVGLNNEIIEWLPGKKTWFFRKSQNEYAKAGQETLKNIESLLLKLEMLSVESDEIINDLVVEVEIPVAKGAH